MATQPTGDYYAAFVVVVWDFDGAPDAEDYFSQGYTDEQLADSILPYFCTRRERFDDLLAAKKFARNEVFGGRASGAAVFHRNGVGEVIDGYGLTFPFRHKYC